MKTAWKMIDTLQVKREVKNKLFILSQVLFYALIGAAVWGVLGRLVLPEIMWFLCFIGYPATFIGFFGSAFYLYKNEFA